MLLSICVLVIGVLLQLTLARALSSRGKGWFAFGSSLIALCAALVRFPLIYRGEVQDVHLLTWDGPITLSYHVDGLSQLFALMALGIGTAILLYSVGYMAHDRSATRFYMLMLTFIAGLVHLVYTSDLFLVYLSWEVIGLCSFLLIGFWYQNREAAAGARKVLVMTHIAGYGLLAAVLLIYLRTGTTQWTDPRVAAAFSTGIFLLMVLAAMAKSVQFPLHTWIPDAMAAPTPVSALLHAACYVKAGVYLVARLHSLGPWPIAWQTLLIWIGTLTLLVGALYAMVQSDIKRLLAFSTVSQIGYMMFGLGLSTPLGIAAGLLHCLNHGIFKGGLFLCAGAVQHATGTRDMDHLGGLGRRMPKTMVLWLIGAGSISGLPLFSGFVSKWLIYNAALEAGQFIPALIAWIVSILTVFYFLKATTGVFLGNETAETTNVHEVPWPMVFGMAILAGGNILLGIAPQLAVGYVINPLLSALGSKPVIGISWLGLTAGSGSWFTTPGLILAILAVGAGVLVYWIAIPAPSKELAVKVSPNGTSDVFSGGEALTGSSHLSASDFSFILKNHLGSFYRWADMDRYYLVLWRQLLRISDAVGGISRWLEERAIIAILILVISFGVLIGLLPKSDGGQSPHAIQPVGWPVIFGIGLSLLALLVTGYTIQKGRRLLPLFAISGLLALLGQVINQHLISLLLLEGSSLVALLMVWKSGKTRAVRFVYLLAVLLSAGAISSGTLMLDSASPNLLLCLMMTGFVLKLALVPLYVWLPMVAEDTSAPIVGLVVSVVDVAAFGELLMLRQSSPWLFTLTGPWLTIALLSTLGGALLMLAQNDLKRLLAFSTIEDTGYLMFGVTLGGDLGLKGAVLGITVHSLAKALLFSSLAFVESDDSPPTLAMRGLAARYPISAFGFLLGALVMIGVPPTAGYIARWRLYGAALQMGFPYLFMMLLSTALALLAYSRVVALCWWGASNDGNKGREPALLGVPIIGLCVILLLVGLWPGLLG
jgi:multicomponent Na+:H+ antiporter subunit A